MESDKSVIKELGRRRVFIFFWGFVIVAIANVIGEESDMFIHVLDDYLDIILAVVAIAIIVAMWRKQTAPQLRRVNNIASILAVLLVLVTIYAISVEIGDPADFGNEIPTLLFGITMLVNRFV